MIAGSPIPTLPGRVPALRDGAWTNSWHRTVADPDPARGPSVPTRLPVMVRGEAVWPVVCATLVRDIQAKMPQDDDEPDDEPEDQPDDESEDDPGTLYFGQKEGWPARSCWSPTSRPSRSAEWTPGAGGGLLSDKITYPKSARPSDRAGVPPLGLWGAQRSKPPFLREGGVLGMAWVRVKENEPIDSAVRRFKKQCEKAGILKELRKREHYEKPSVRRKKKAVAARKRAIRRTARNPVA